MQEHYSKTAKSPKIGIFALRKDENGDIIFYPPRNSNYNYYGISEHCREGNINQLGYGNTPHSLNVYYTGKKKC